MTLGWQLGDGPCDSAADLGDVVSDKTNFFLSSQKCPKPFGFPLQVVLLNDVLVFASSLEVCTNKLIKVVTFKCEGG